MGTAKQHLLENILWLRQLSPSAGTAGQMSTRRLHNLPAIVPKLRQIVLHHRIFVHICVHGRHQQLRTAAGQHRSGQHIVCQSVGQLSDNVGGGRSNHHAVCLVRQCDVLHLPGMIPVKGICDSFSVAKTFKGQGCDEFRGMLRHDHIHPGVLLYQPGAKIRRLVGRNAAGHPQQNIFSLQHNFPPDI